MLRTSCTLLLVALAAPAVRAGLPAPPVQKWAWEGDVRDPVRNFPIGVPVVVQLTDDDADGDIDADDFADVAFLHWGFNYLDYAAVTALDGRTGTELFTFTDPPFSVMSADGSPLAAGDVDGDGLVEFVVTTGSVLRVFEHDGSYGWSRPLPVPVGGPGSAIAIADLNHDGVPELTLRNLVVSADGSLSWAGAHASGFGESSSSFSQAADLSPASPGLELLAGHSLYSATGALLWRNTGVPDGAAAIADLDGNGTPEIVLTARNDATVHVLDATGTEIVPPAPINSIGNVTQPLLADVDGDTLPEVAVPGGTVLNVLTWRAGGLEMLWQATIDDGSCCADLTAFDFDGDGAMEIVQRDHGHWRVFGCGGQVLHEEPSVSCTAYEAPVVANFDDDPEAEILISGLQFVGAHLNSVVAYDVPGSVTPRSVWNQKTCHVTNVEDDGGIPVVEIAPWTARNDWHAQAGPPPVTPEIALDAAWSTDVSPCRAGLRVEWTAPVTAGSLGPITFDVHRSEASPTCADAIARPAVATGLADLSWLDTGTQPGGTHAHVVVARADGPCGEITASACVDPPTFDEASLSFPDGVFAALRASNVEDEVTFEWSRARALLPDEHFHLKKSPLAPQGPFTRVSAEGELARSYTETDTSAWLQFFDLRVANACEDESLPEYP